MLDALFRPSSIAVIGASRTSHGIGSAVLQNLVTHRFRGAIYPIHPSGGELHGLRVYSSITQVPTDVDLVNIAVHRDKLTSVIEQCARKGVKFAVIHSAGFQEVGAEGAQLQKRLVSLANHHGIRVLGPNCQGVQNSDSTVSMYANFTFTPMTRGPVGILAQAGGIGEMLQQHLYRCGVGYRMYASFGNESDVSMHELLDYYDSDDAVRVVVMQAESFRFPQELAAVARRVSKTKPIFALKTARSAPGAKAAVAHTGVASSLDGVSRPLLEDSSIRWFNDVSQLVHVAAVASTQGKARGKRLGIVTNSGGPAIQAVDAAHEAGLELATWSASSIQRLKGSVFEQASLGNPLDIVATAGPEQFYEAVTTVLSDDAVDMALVFFVAAQFVDVQATARSIAKACVQSSKPVVAVVCEPQCDGPVAQTLRGAGVLTFEFVEPAVRGLAELSEWG